MMQDLCLIEKLSGQTHWQNIGKGKFGSFIVLVTVFSYCAHQTHILHHLLTLVVTIIHASKQNSVHARTFNFSSATFDESENVALPFLIAQDELERRTRDAHASYAGENQV